METVLERFNQWVSELFGPDFDKAFARLIPADVSSYFALAAMIASAIIPQRE
jgi:hypothetical protein